MRQTATIAAVAQSRDRLAWFSFGTGERDGRQSLVKAVDFPPAG